MKNGEVIDKDGVCHRVYLTYIGSTLTKSPCRVWRIENKRTSSSQVKYADVLVLLAKEETVLQDMTDRLIETGRC